MTMWVSYLDNRKEKAGYWKLRGSTRSYSAENLLWKRLWTGHNTDYRMDEWVPSSQDVKLITHL